MSHTLDPGPAEAAVLADLAPVFRVRRVEARGGSLRVLEGGEGPPLVVIHGRGNAATSWGAALPALARTRRVLAVDLPGFGASRGYRFTGGDAEAGIAFFVDPIEAWLAAEGLSGAAIMGHSLGGFVAVELTLRGRVAPRALVLIAPMGVGPEETLASRVYFRLGPERVARLIGRDAFARVTGSETPRAAALAHEIHAVPGGRADASRAFDTLVPLLGPLPHRRDRLRSIQTRTLVIAGDTDPVFPAPVAMAAAAVLPNAELHVEAAGHSPHAEAPDRVIPRIDAFL